MVRPRGQAHEALDRCKKEFCGGQGAKRRRPWRLALGQTPRPMASGPDAKDCGVWSWSPSGTLAFWEKTDFEEAFAPSFDPGAQHINRGAGLAPKTQQVDPRDLFLSRVRCPLPPYSSIIL